MLRSFACALTALVLASGLSFGAAAEKKKKKNTQVIGTVQKVDAAAGTLVITSKKKGETTDKEFKVAGAVKFNIVVGTETKEFTGKTGLNEVKVGARVAVVSDPNGEVLSVQVGGGKKKGKKPAATTTEAPKTEAKPAAVPAPAPKKTEQK